MAESPAAFHDVYSAAARTGTPTVVRTIWDIAQESEEITFIAADWLADDAEAGNHACQVVVAHTVAESGELEVAVKLLTKARSVADEAILDYQALLPTELDRTEEAVAIWRQLAHTGYIVAIANLSAHFHHTGDQDQAEYWHRIAVDLATGRAT
ncbi:hypothetical protein [Actinokineospora inagensis]|uniref:hypothetical protein n=1 Tax=Actinokineospora inagensis TaxID=103730 RepID=UPI00040E64CC|nr:hypothetical protein [Actinokineospora inagensis]